MTYLSYFQIAIGLVQFYIYVCKRHGAWWHVGGVLVMNMPTCALCHLRVRVPSESVLLPSPHLRSQSHPPVVNPKLILIGRVVLWDSFLRQSFFNWHFYIFGRHWQSFEDDVCPRIEFGDPPSLPPRWRSRVPVAVALLFPPAKHALWGPMTTNKFSSRDGKLLEGIGSQNFARSKQAQTFARIASKHHPAGKKLWLLGQWKNIFWR